MQLNKDTVRSVLVLLALIPAWWVTANFLNLRHTNQPWLGFMGAAAVEGVYWYALNAVIGKQTENALAWLVIVLFGAASYAAQVLTFASGYQAVGDPNGIVNVIAVWILPAAPVLAPLAIALVDVPLGAVIRNPLEGKRFSNPFGGQSKNKGGNDAPSA